MVTQLTERFAQLSEKATERFNIVSVLESMVLRLASMVEKSQKPFKCIYD